MSDRHEEVNYVGSSSENLTTGPNILSIENLVESKGLLATEDSSIRVDLICIRLILTHFF